MNKGAIISECEQYRYQLWRIWDKSKPMALFIMLNPSTADANEDDPTIRRCVGFAKSWGYGGLYVGNLFAFRSTDPNKLLHAQDPIGRENNHHLKEMGTKCDIAICAWGNYNIIYSINISTASLLYNIDTPLCYLELSVKGTPKHPLYLKKDLVPLSAVMPIAIFLQQLEG